MYDMSKIAEEIINLEIDMNSSLSKTREDFYNILRKHGVKYGTKMEHGYSCANFEWSMCMNLFIETISMKIELDALFNEVPEDIRY